MGEGETEWGVATEVQGRSRQHQVREAQGPLPFLLQDNQHLDSPLSLTSIVQGTPSPTSSLT